VIIFRARRHIDRRHNGGIAVHKICPYSHATRGNIEFALEVEGA
jgi:organic hydroperoxide reductase OsmC/OhrA